VRVIVQSNGHAVVDRTATIHSSLAEITSATFDLSLTEDSFSKLIIDNEYKIPMCSTLRIYFDNNYTPFSCTIAADIESYEARPSVCGIVTN